MGVFDARPVLLVIGTLLTTLGFAMFLPAFYDAAERNPDWVVFTASATFTIFFGISLTLMNWGTGGELSLKQAFVLVPASWVALVTFGAMPFVFSELQLGYTDAFFEAMSGITTTGSTVIVGLDDAPPGLLLWRSLLQWLGGIGIIVTAVSLLPMLQVGGMQMFKVEAFDTPEKVLPSAAGLAASITVVYVVFTFVCAALLWSAGMTFFDGINHAMTTIATGGYSTHDASIGFYEDPLIDYVITGGMIAGSLPFVLYIQAASGRWRPLWRDAQVRAFLGIVAVVTFIMTVFQHTHGLNHNVGDQFRYSLFNVVSVVTGTGYSNHSYDAWGPFAVMVFFVLMFIGGCSGSTSCGMKVFRAQVMFAAATIHLKRIVHPNGVFVARYNGRRVPDSVMASVMSFFVLYMASFAVLSLLLTFTGMDMVTATSSAATAIANVGPGLGPEVGPSGNFANIPDTAKWLLSGGMLLGRLELFTVLILFSRVFWRS